MCNTPLHSIYFKCATHGDKLSNVQHPVTNFQMCNTLRETFKCAAQWDKLSNVQHTARNFQTCSTLWQTFKCATQCEKFSDKDVLHRKTSKPQKRRSMGHLCYTYHRAVCSLKLLDSASHVAAVAVAILTICFPGLVVRSCRSRHQLVCVWVPLPVYYSEMLMLYVCEIDCKPGRISIAPPPRYCTFPSSLSRLLRGVFLFTQQALGVVNWWC